MAMEVSKKKCKVRFLCHSKTVLYPFESVQLIRLKTLLTNLHNIKDLTASSGFMCGTEIFGAFQAAFCAKTAFYSTKLFHP